MTDEPKTNGDAEPTPGPQSSDANSPDAPDPVGITADVFDLAALVTTVKDTFNFKEETALKAVELALNFRLTKEQMEMAKGPPPGANLRSLPFPDDPPPKPE